MPTNDLLSTGFTVLALLALAAVTWSFDKRIWPRLRAEEKFVLGVLLLIEGGLMIWEQASVAGAALLLATVLAAFHLRL